MIAKSLPGLVIALVLGIVFCLPETKNEPAPTPPSDGKWTVARADVAAASSGTPFFSSIKTPGKIEPDRTALEKAGAGNALLSAAVPAVVPFVVPISASAVEPAAEPSVDAGGRFAEVASTGGRFAEVASTTVWRGRAEPSSALALASVDDACVPETSAWIPTANYPELPAKGLEVWTEARQYREKQSNEEGSLFHSAQNTFYRHKGNVYSLGLRQDWSIDSVVGVSMDVLDAQVRGRYDGDSRRNDIVGYFANAHYEGTFVGRFPVEMKGTYGRVYNESKGSFVNYRGVEEIIRLSENRHSSHYYGFSAKAGIPLLFSGFLKVLPEIGVDYRQVRTGERKQHAFEDRSLVIHHDEMRSKSLLVPLTVTARRDFRQCWGVATPRATLGYAREFEKTATGVRVFNSSSASAQSFDAGTNGFQPVVFDPAQKDLWRFGAGLDVRSVGGWNVSADYARHWSKGYAKDEFKLELGRCF